MSSFITYMWGKVALLFTALGSQGKGFATRLTTDGTALANAGTIGVDFTIDNDDGIVSMAATTASVTEGGMAEVTVRISSAQSEDVVVVVTTSDGTASSADLTGETTPDYGTPDYTALTGNAAQVTIAAGMTELRELVDFSDIDDAVVEGIEGVRSSLAFRDLTGTGLDSGNLNLGVTSADQHEEYSLFPDGATATVTITDDD